MSERFDIIYKQFSINYVSASPQRKTLEEMETEKTDLQKELNEGKVQFFIFCLFSIWTFFLT